MANLTNLCDEDSELVEVAETLGAYPQLPNHLVELLCPCNRILQGTPDNVFHQELTNLLNN